MDVVGHDHEGVDAMLGKWAGEFRQTFSAIRPCGKSCIAPSATSPNRQLGRSCKSSRNTPPAPCSRRWRACGEAMHRASVCSPARTWCEEPDFFRWFSQRGRQARLLRKSEKTVEQEADFSEDAFLALEVAEGADIGHREGQAELILIARSQVETAVLHA